MSSLWSNRTWLTWVLWPFSMLFGLIVLLRKTLYQLGILKKWRSPVPLIVVGNLTVGGNGKTPFVIWLSKRLSEQGYRVGIVSRGYGGTSAAYPLMLTQKTTPEEAGDEPVLIYQRTGLPVAVAPKRPEAVHALLAAYPIDIIISDDGLQHYALERDKEIVIVESDFGFGNELLLPAGPLREPKSRLNAVDLIVVNGCREKIRLPVAVASTEMRIQPAMAINLVTAETRAVSQLSDVHALAGIGRPERFFDLLTELGIPVKQCHAFWDHHSYNACDLMPLLNDHETLLMTEKDAVKCRAFAKPNWWYLPITAKVDRAVIGILLSGLFKNNTEE